jgi:hypothetical protein
MVSSKPISIVQDGSLPVVLGDCPNCKLGPRSLILIDFVPNLGKPDNSTVYLKCISCNSIHQRKIKEVAEGS